MNRTHAPPAPTPAAGVAAVYGAPPAELAGTPPDARQVSPLVPGALALEALEEGALAGMVLYAPPGRLERRYQLALAL